MTLILKQLFSFLKILNSETGENQIAFGIAFGVILGFSPLFSLQTLLVFVFLFFFRVQMGAAFISSFVFSFVAYLFDPLCEMLGSWALELTALEGLYTTLYNLPIIPFTRFNNSLVMGSFLVGMILFIPVFFLSKKMIIKYRVTILTKIKGTKLFKVIEKTALFKWYAKYNQLYG